MYTNKELNAKEKALSEKLAIVFIKSDRTMIDLQIAGDVLCYDQSIEQTAQRYQRSNEYVQETVTFFREKTGVLL